MYNSSPVPIPKPDRGCITIKRIKGISYVYYDTYRYDKGKKRSVSISRSIGKLDLDKPGMMKPNENYAAYFESDDDNELGQSTDDNNINNATLTEEETHDECDSNDESDNGNSTNEREFKFSYVHASWIAKVGCFIIINAILETLNLKEILQQVLGLGATYALFLDLVAYMIITEDNTGWHYPAYARNHALFSKDMRIASDSTISRFFMNVEEDASLQFLDLWNARQDHENRIYIAYDSTNKNCQAGDVDMAEFGHAKDDPSKPIINYAVAYDLNNKVPLLYDYYAGCINDVTELQSTVEMLNLYGYNMISFIIDRGYFSYSNIKYMEEHGFGFLIMVKGMKSFVRGLVSSVKGTFETDPKCYISLYGVFGTTVKCTLCDKDSTDKYFHIYYNRHKAANEQHNLIKKIEDYTKIFEKKLGKTIKLTKEIEKYFTFTYDTDGKLQSFAQKDDVIKAEMEFAGYFVIISRDEMTARQALYLYKSRDANEKLFRMDKSYLGNSSERTHYNESTQTKMLVGFVALIVRNHMHVKLTEKAEQISKKQDYLTVEGAIDKLEEIEIHRTSQYKYRLAYPLTKYQKLVISSFGISPAMFKRKALEIGEQLTASAKKDPRTEISE